MEKSVVHLLWNSIGRFPEKDALRYKSGGDYRGITYRELGDAIERLTHGMAAVGLQPGDRIAILSYNRPEWPMADFAIFCLRGITVPVYHTLPPGQIAYILKDAGVRAIFVEDAIQYRKIQEIRAGCPALEYLFPMSGEVPRDEKTISFQRLLEIGAAHQRENPDFCREQIGAIQPMDICSIVYTSGTVGEPKGVMLHHKGFVTDIESSISVFGLYPEDVFLSFLPLSHLYERVGGHWCPLSRGCTIAYAESINSVVEDVPRVRPTVMVSVPRLYEKISSAVIEQVEAKPPMAQKLFYWSLKTGRRYHAQRRAGNLRALTALGYRLANRLVFNKIRQKLGGRFRFPISGGAPLSVETLKFFEAMGLSIVEGYGMTETHLIITLTPPGNTRYGSCGRPIPGVSVKIGEDGEILVSGPTLMAGYYNKPDQTRQVIDQDGWLHTGDIGYMDEDDYLYITDRKKNILVTAGGKNVAPAPIENALKKSKYIEDVCLVGDGRKFISAIVIPNYESVRGWAAKNGLSFADNRELVQNDRVNRLIQEEIERHQSDFARYEKVKKFILLPEPLSVERGELTPSLKIKRRVVEEKYREAIDQLYQN